MIDLRVHLPKIITRLFPSATWSIPIEEKKVAYLTFDDGPVPEVTPDVLKILDRYNVKATFFCVGENVEKHNDIYQQVLDCGHTVANHTYNHVKGYELTRSAYLENIDKAAKVIDSELFRPPHGWMKSTQIKPVASKYQIIMWDVISCDYDAKLSPKQCYNNVVNFVRNGSIITFHDSIKAKKNVLEALPLTIEYLLKEGYELKPIISGNLRPIYGDNTKLKYINPGQDSNKKLA